jgi:hypothetical protein
MNAAVHSIGPVPSVTAHLRYILYPGVLAGGLPSLNVLGDLIGASTSAAAGVLKHTGPILPNEAEPDNDAVG